MQTDTRPRPTLPTPTPAPKNSRRNEIIAIALLAVGVLFALCLVPYSYSPDDPSWTTSVGAKNAHNWIGVIGAWVAETLFQFVGLAAYLLPVLLLFVAWRRFRLRRINAPLSIIAGLALLLLSLSALLNLLNLPKPFDGKFEPGGMAGEFVARLLAGGLNTVGASVLLLALAATGLLLATNFSFAHLYEHLVDAFHNRFDVLRTLPARFRTWQAQRQQLARERAAQRQEAHAEQQATGEEKKRTREQTAAERVAEFMNGAATGASTHATTKQPQAESAAEVAVRRNGLAASTETLGAPRSEVDGGFAAPTAPRAPANGDLPAVTPAPKPAPQPVLAPIAPPTSAITDETEDEVDAAEVAEMVRNADVVRVEPTAEAEALAAMQADKAERAAAKRVERVAASFSTYRLPPHDFLNAAPPRHEQADEELRNLATRVAEKCREFNVTGKIEYICPGPVVTTYEFKPDPGVKYSRVTGLVDDLCLALKAESIRIDRVPGKAHVGIEVPNPERDNIMLREVLESKQYRESPSKLTLALGKGIDGLNYVADLAKMPHLLIAGATGTGKSVCLNSLVVSILYKARPDEVKFIMIDPKRLELGLYADIPHLATPIITEPKRAANALKWAVAQMEARYKQLAQWGVRNIDGFNQEIMRRNAVEDFDEQGEPWKPLPYIVIIVDELADLMMTSGHEVEEAITRLAQMARAVGIHLILATQRPSVDVITGLIKANFPSRIAFRVSSKVDSRTIIDANGAEQLLGRGDMLFLPPGTSRLVRVHGAYLDEAEIGEIVKHIKAQGAPVYDESITQSEEETTGGDGSGGAHDELFDQALRICVEMKRASTSVLQRRLRIGYGRAAAILDGMEREGYIAQADGARPRAILGRAYETIAHWEEQERGNPTE